MLSDHDKWGVPYVMHIIRSVDDDAWLFLVSYRKVWQGFCNQINCDIFWLTIGDVCHVMSHDPFRWLTHSFPSPGPQEDAATYRAAYEEAREAGANLWQRSALRADLLQR